MSVPSGQVYLVKNALVDRSYSHTISFKDASEQLAYWRSLVKYSLSEYSYIRRSSQLIKVDKTLDELQDVNYLFYRAKEDSKLYYCFITNKEYIAENTTAIYFEVDVLQTRQFEYKVKESYVLQEHCDRWDANLKPIYSRTEENLDYGSEYTVESGYKVQHNYTEYPIRWYLAVCKAHNNLVQSGHNAKEPTRIHGANNPYILYLLPDSSYFDSSTSDFYEIEGNSGETFTVSGITEFSKKMADSELGNYVQQIIKLPYFNFTSKDSPVRLKINNKGITVTETDLGAHKPFLRVKEIKIEGLTFDLAEMDLNEGIKDALPTDEQWAQIKANPYNVERDKRFESKLLTHPYRYNLLTDWKNQPQIIKNEYIGSEKIKLKCTQSISFNSPTRFWIDGYKKDPEGRGTSVLQLIQDESPVITDAYYNYILQNKNQIEANKTNAIVSGITSSVNSVAGGMVSGALMGGGPGAIANGLLGGVMSGAHSIANYNNMIRSENAKQKDLKNMPDTILNSNDGTFNIQDGNEYITFYRYKICCEFENLLADTFAMSGYTVKRVKLPNLKTRLRFNYVKTVGANIVGSFDQNDISMLRNIFDNGVTFWHYDANHKDDFKMLDYSLENIERNLI